MESLRPYVDFFGNAGIFNGTSYNKEDAEEIIKWITIFDDKDILEKKVRDNYPELNDNQIKNILFLPPHLILHITMPHNLE